MHRIDHAFDAIDSRFQVVLDRIQLHACRLRGAILHSFESIVLANDQERWVGSSHTLLSFRATLACMEFDHCSCTLCAAPNALSGAKFVRLRMPAFTTAPHTMTHACRGRFSPTDQDTSGHAKERYRPAA